jgi:hypothetical protein
VTPAGNRASVRLAYRDLVVVPSVDKRDHLTGTVSYSLVRPHLRWETTPTGETALVGQSCPFFSYCNAQPTLAVPAGQTAEAYSGSGDMQASGVGGALTLGDGSGDIGLDNLPGPLVLDDSSGDISGDDLASATVRAHDWSGDVDLSFSRAPDQVRVSDSSGDIRVVPPTGVPYLVMASTSSGSTSIDVPTNPSSHHIIYLTDASGDIAVEPSQP